MTFIKIILFFISLVFSSKKIKFNEDIRIHEQIVSLIYYNFRLIPKNQNPSPRKSLFPKSIFAGSDWLKLVDGNKKVFSLSIPGTHETCARFVPERYQCQDWTIE